MNKEALFIVTSFFEEINMISLLAFDVCLSVEHYLIWHHFEWILNKYFYEIKMIVN